MAAPAPADAAHYRRPAWWAGAASLVVLSLLFHGMYWNRFLGPSSSGMFFYTAELLLDGKTPYRDFFLIVPILHPLKTSALLYLAGHKMLVLRADAVLERTLLAVLVFSWLRRFTPTVPAFLGALLGLVAFAGDSTDPLSSYHQDSAFWAVCAGFAATRCLESGRRQLTWAATAGLATSLCFWTKQTTGIGILAAIPGLWLLLEWRRGPAHMARLTGSFAAGALPASLALAGWLKHRGALGAFWDSVFGNSSAKGAGLDLFLRPVLQMWVLAIPSFAIVAMLAWLVWRSPAGPEPAWRVRLGGCAAVAGLSFVAIPLTAKGDTEVFSYLLAGVLLLGGLYGCGWIACATAWKALAGELNPAGRALLLMSGAGFATAYMLSLSWAAYGPMAMPSLAVCTAIAVARIGSRNIRMETIATGLALLVTALMVVKKAREPFYWMAWMETAVARASETSDAPMLEGIRLTPETRVVFDGVTGLIRAKSQPGDTLLVYPYFPIFYSSTGLNAPTFSFNHFMDVTPAWVVDRDVAALRRSPPRFLVYLVEDPGEVEVNERVFRGGQKSESRRVAAAIVELTRDYRRLGSFRTPGKLCDLQVWERLMPAGGSADSGRAGSGSK